MASIEKMIAWFEARKGKVTYSMNYRNGPNSYDCSSAVYYALMAGGFLPVGTYPGNTESLYRLEGSLLQPISRANAKRGDIFVAGVKGASSGAFGHTGVFTSNSTIIHCNGADDGISETPFAGRTGSPVYCYRLKGASPEPVKERWPAIKMGRKSPTTGLSYNPHLQHYSWTGWCAGGETAGTTGLACRLEALDIRINGDKRAVLKSTHVQKDGWSDWSTEICGTEGQGKRLEAIKLKLTPLHDKDYDIEYRVHVQKKGWLAWVKNGEVAGTTGKSLRIEAIEIKLVPKK